jgi:hypothetical protein
MMQEKTNLWTIQPHSNQNNNFEFFLNLQLHSRKIALQYSLITSFFSHATAPTKNNFNNSIITKINLIGYSATTAPTRNFTAPRTYSSTTNTAPTTYFTAPTRNYSLIPPLPTAPTNKFTALRTYFTAPTTYFHCTYKKSLSLKLLSFSKLSTTMNDCMYVCFFNRVLFNTNNKQVTPNLNLLNPR